MCPRTETNADKKEKLHISRIAHPDLNTCKMQKCQPFIFILQTLFLYSLLFEMKWCLNVLQGTFNCLWNCLHLILILLYDHYCWSACWIRTYLVWISRKIWTFPYDGVVRISLREGAALYSGRTLQRYAIFYPQLLQESTKVTCWIFNWSNLTMTFPLCRLQALHLSRRDVIPPEPTADVAAMVTTRQSQRSAEVDCGRWSCWPNSWLDLLAVCGNKEQTGSKIMWFERDEERKQTRDGWTARRRKLCRDEEITCFFLTAFSHRSLFNLF